MSVPERRPHTLAQPFQEEGHVGAQVTFIGWPAEGTENVLNVRADEDDPMTDEWDDLD